MQLAALQVHVAPLEANQLSLPQRVRRCPDPMPGEESEIELRPIFEAGDFGAEFTPELRAQEDRLRAELERKGK